MSHKIDCTNTMDYLKTRAKATRISEDGCCRIHCNDCPLMKQKITNKCEVLEYLHPKETIKLLQDYADEDIYYEDILFKPTV